MAYIDQSFSNLTANGSDTTIGTLSELPAIPSNAVLDSVVLNFNARRDGGYTNDSGKVSVVVSGNTITAKSGMSRNKDYSNISVTLTSYVTNNNGVLSYTDGTTSLSIRGYHDYYVFGQSDWTISSIYIRANYTIPTYTLTVTASTGGTASGGGTYDNQASATLAAIPSTGYKFVHWSDGNTSATRTVTVTGNAAYTAQFEKIVYDIGYDNLFSLSQWAAAAEAEGGLKTNRGGDLYADLKKGTLSITCPEGVSPDNNYCPWTYDITIEKNTDYVFVYNAIIQGYSEGQNGMQVHLFLNTGKDVVGTWGTFPNDPYIYDGTSFKIISFNSEQYDNVNVRLGTVGGLGVTNVFLNIGLYKKEDYESYIKDYTKVRDPFSIGDIVDLMTPSREGYVFTGWNSKADGTGTMYTSGSDFPTSSLTLYSQWKVNKIYIGISQSKAIYVGTTPVKAIYIGTTKVYEQ